MTWANTDRERIAQIRHATRNRCRVAGMHDAHTHVCDQPGDHSGFGDGIGHTADCDGKLYTWSTALVQLALFEAVAS